MLVKYIVNGNKHKLYNLVMVLPDLFQALGTQKNSPETQHSIGPRPPRFGTEIKRWKK